MILGPSISQEVYWNSLSCSRLHRFVASTQSQTLSPDCHAQQGCCELQGLYEQDYFHRDDSNKKDIERFEILGLYIQTEN